jgi:RNase P subunit RPR2
MTQADKIKIKPFWKRMLCIHVFTPNVIKVKDRRGRKRFTRICKLCGQRDYMD